MIRIVHSRCAAFILLALTAACSPSSSPPTATVSGDGFAGVRFGMSVVDAEKALGVRLKMLGEPEGDCAYAEPVGAHPGLGFMVIGNVIARLDVGDTSTIATDVGAKIGDTEKRVLDLYKGRTRVEPHHYTGPEGHYVLVLDKAGKAQIVFETDGAKVVSYRAGRQPEVEWVEGCS